METRQAAAFRLPEDVKTIIAELERSGYEAYAVGGCVRDMILGREPGDWDITTSARPQEVKHIFRRTVDTGIEHGTVTVLMGGCGYEVTTYRVDGDYTDLRHPSEVTFTASLEEDLKRRDFTINAMAYSETAGLVDLYGGAEDLQRQLIRCVGDPDDRFGEDALRILRAVRFAAQLDFEIEEGTKQAVARHAANLSAVSKERILTELSKLVCSAHIEKTAVLKELGLSGYIAAYFDEVDIPHVCSLRESAGTEEMRGLWDYAAARSARTGDGDEEEGAAPVGDPRTNFRAYDLEASVPAELRRIRFALLLEGMESGKALALLKSLKADNLTAKQGAFLAEQSLIPLPPDRYGLKKAMSVMKPELFRDLLYIKLASSLTGKYREACAGEDIREVIALFEEIMESGEPVYLNDLVLTGRDLMNLGAAEGPEIGRILSRMLDAVQRNPQFNTVMYLISNFYHMS